MSQRPAHIAMIGSADVGHVIPTLEILRELVDRGHRVTCANEHLVGDMIRSVGAEFLPYTRDVDWPTGAIEAMDALLDSNVQMLPQLRAVYDADPADLYLYDIGSFAARALAESHDRPLVQLSPTMVGQKVEAELTEQIETLPGAAEFQERFAKWLAESGAMTRDIAEFCDPPRVLALIPKVLQPGSDELDEDVVTFVGPCISSREEQGGWTRPPGAEKVLLISMGTVYLLPPDFYLQCIAAFGDLPGWHVVLQVGRNIDPAELGTLPANIEVHRWVPQLAILQQADLFVTHAGAGGCSEALISEVPMITVPQGADQLSNADQLVEAGVARRIDTADVTAERLRAAMDALAGDPEVAARLRTLSAETWSADASARAADLIEAMLPSHAQD